MRAYASKFCAGSVEDCAAEENLWGIVGLIHDFDYEKYPSREDHPYKGNEILKERGWPERNPPRHHVARRIQRRHSRHSHGEGTFRLRRTGRIHHRGRVGQAGEIAGRSGRRSIRKKMKDKAFARSVNRDDIINGAADLGVDLDAHIAFCIEALKGIADKLDLDGSAAKAK